MLPSINYYALFHAYTYNAMQLLQLWMGAGLAMEVMKPAAKHVEGVPK